MAKKRSGSDMNGSRTPWTFRVFLVLAIIAGLVVMARTHGNLVASVGTTLLVLAVPFGFILWFNRDSWF